MRLSDKKRMALYAAVSDPIKDLRVKRYGAFANHPELQVDNDLFQLELEVWRRVRAALNLEEPTP